jgi:hypothetical protein
VVGVNLDELAAGRAAGRPVALLAGREAALDGGGRALVAAGLLVGRAFVGLVVQVEALVARQAADAVLARGAAVLGLDGRAVGVDLAGGRVVVADAPLAGLDGSTGAG